MTTSFYHSRRLKKRYYPKTIILKCLGVSRYSIYRLMILIKLLVCLIKIHKVQNQISDSYLVPKRRIKRDMIPCFRRNNHIASLYLIQCRDYSVIYTSFQKQRVQVSRAKAFWLFLSMKRRRELKWPSLPAATSLMRPTFLWSDCPSWIPTVRRMHVEAWHHRSVQIIKNQSILQLPCPNVAILKRLPHRKGRG